MILVDRQSFLATSRGVRASLFELLVLIVTGLTQRLPVIRIPKQDRIALVRREVIDDRGRLPATRHRANGMQREEFLASFLPVIPVAAGAVDAFHCNGDRARARDRK